MKESLEAYQARLARWEPCRPCFYVCVLLWPVAVFLFGYGVLICYREGYYVTGGWVAVAGILLALCWSCNSYIRPPEQKIEEDEG